MKPVVIPHKQYQLFVLEQLQTHYTGSLLVLRHSDWPVIAKLWMTDLSRIASLVSDSYSDKGRKPRDPIAVFRCFLLFLFTNPTIGLTAWVEELHRVPLYAVLSGFEPQDVPGVGTFYDLFPRLWKADAKHLKPTRQPKKKKKPKRGNKKGEKAATSTPARVRRLIKRLTQQSHSVSTVPTDPLFEFFQTQIAATSAELGLLGDPTALNVAGDGTPLVTAAFTRSKATCNCFAEGHRSCRHPRIHSQPDCDIGWDSSRERYFAGHHLYVLSASDSPHDLPLYAKLQPASRHDSVSLVISSFEFQQRWTLAPIKRMLLDAAHDAQAIYEMLDEQGIEPFIDLNPRTKQHDTSRPDIKLSAQGIPMCPAGHPMKPNGYEKLHDRQKWRCPRASGTSNTCTQRCSDAKYGRTFHTYPKCNLRLHPRVVRGSTEWKLIYKRRTSVERSNKRQKIDYHLEAGRHRSIMMWYMRLYGIMICQHIDAWYAVRQDQLAPLKTRLLGSAA